MYHPYEQAQQKQLWIVAGTLPICDSPDDERPLSACLVFNDRGEEVARYNKIHLFDVNIKDKQGSYQESRTYQPGKDVVTVETPFGTVTLKEGFLDGETNTAQPEFDSVVAVADAANVPVRRVLDAVKVVLASEGPRPGPTRSDE